jgi:hypothetical protein
VNLLLLDNRICLGIFDCGCCGCYCWEFGIIFGLWFDVLVGCWKKKFLGLVCVVLGLDAFGHHVIEWVCEGFWVLPSWTLLLVEADGQRHEGWGNHGEETEQEEREKMETKVNGVRPLLRNLTESCAMTKTLVQL